jgi:hypothetical protein
MLALQPPDPNTVTFDLAIDWAYYRFRVELFPSQPLTYDEVRTDCDSVVASVARQYTDQSCVELHYEDLISEGNRKITECINKGVFERFSGRRSELFRWIKTCVNNHIKGLVHRYRGTYKRTGLRPPAKGETNWGFRPKPEVSLDDPEANIRLPHHHEPRFSNFPSLKADMAVILNPVEFLVFRQLVEPDDAALTFAMQDAYRGRRGYGELRVRVTSEHMACALGLAQDQFLQVQASVQRKVKDYMSDPKSADVARNAAVTSLEKTFRLHIPRSVEPVVVRRLLTLAARANPELVDQKVATLLESAGAKVPKFDAGGNLNCFGVLYQRENRVCASCGLRESCAIEAANYGLGEVTLSPKLLGAKGSARTATFTDSPAEAIEAMGAAPLAPPPPRAEPLTETPLEEASASHSRVYRKAVPQTQREDEIEAHLYDQFRPMMFTDDLYFKHRVEREDRKSRHCFWLGRVDNLPGGHFALRFCKPSDALKDRLLHHDVSYYLPPDCSIEEAIRLIDQHADEAFRI